MDALFEGKIAFLHADLNAAVIRESGEMSCITSNLILRDQFQLMRSEDVDEVLIAAEFMT